MYKLLTAIVMITGISAPAFAAEPIVGSWKRSNGTIISYQACGTDTFCGTVMTGEYKGKSIGQMKGKGTHYDGMVNKLDEGKTYKGRAEVSGTSMKLAGCVLGGLICKNETLTKQ
ncbi:DUF2147 domain-containing protein [Limoniibacter endophyticus]|uniref:DUF2147 domain-containing protein n=1 Tax=Limoniibacter endophyticus TaxID=1565040 RepID=A0A8J3GHZ4_9HYPH|nr:DUF2147 domain-containing protein [Limoniibacter endophyticus]GHC69187.1 hypothetical protein GCM10010136_14700 [Limoniibacter endophyticus]